MVCSFVAVADVLTTGEAASTSGAPTGSTSAFASCAVSELLVPPIGPPRLWLTVMTFVSRPWMLAATEADAPLPTATSRITAPTPIVMPSVSAERSLFAARPAAANRIVSSAFTPAPADRRRRCGRR